MVWCSKGCLYGVLGKTETVCTPTTQGHLDTLGTSRVGTTRRDFRYPSCRVISEGTLFPLLPSPWLATSPIVTTDPSQHLSLSRWGTVEIGDNSYVITKKTDPRPYTRGPLS